MDKYINSRNRLNELNQSEYERIIGGCTDETIFHKIGCAIATFVNRLEEDMNDGDVHDNGPRNGYYF